MKIRLQSIAAKLFYLTTILVVVTVAGNSLQNAIMFNKHVSHQEEETTVELAQERASMIDSLFLHWRAELALLVHSLGQRTNTAEREAELASYLEADRDAVALAIYQEPVVLEGRPEISANTKAVSSSNFEGLPAETVLKDVQSAMPKVLAARLAQNSARRVMLGSVTAATHLPIVLVMLPFSLQGGSLKADAPGSDAAAATSDPTAAAAATANALKGAPPAQHRYWVVMAVWASRVVALLPQNNLLRARLLGAGGDILASPDIGEAFQTGFPLSSTWAKDSLAGAQPFGLKIFRDHTGEEWLGAFAHLPDGEATLLVEKNSRAQHVAANAIIRRSALWGWAFVLLAILVSFAGSAGVTANLRALGKATKEIAEGNLQATVQTKGRDEVAGLGESVRHMAGRIQNLLTEQVAKAQLEKELETAQAVQNALFPKVAMGIAGRLTVASFYQSASQCGGDWWGWFATGEHSGFLCIGDATGHGAGAALVTALAYSGSVGATSSHTSRSGTRTTSPANLLEQLNELLWGSVGQHTAMTFFAAHIDLERGTITFANAGHNLPILCPSDPNDDRYPTKPTAAGTEAVARARGEPIYLGKGGLPLGMNADSTYTEQSKALRPGDKIIFYTDGLIECTNPELEQWGKRRLLRILRDRATASAEDLTTGLRDAAQAHFGSLPPADDVTLLVLEVVDGQAVAANVPATPTAA